MDTKHNASLALARQAPGTLPPVDSLSAATSTVSSSVTVAAISVPEISDAIGGSVEGVARPASANRKSAPAAVRRGGVRTVACSKDAKGARRPPRPRSSKSQTPLENRQRKTNCLDCTRTPRPTEHDDRPALAFTYTQTMSDDEEDEACPLCTEMMDLTDRTFRPCQCGYQVCVVSVRCRARDSACY